MDIKHGMEHALVRLVFNHYWIVTITMKTILHTMLNAMEHANTGNLHEFHQLLELEAPVSANADAAAAGWAGERQQAALNLNVKPLCGA